MILGDTGGPAAKAAPRATSTLPRPERPAPGLRMPPGAHGQTPVPAAAPAAPANTGGWWDKAATLVMDKARENSRPVLLEPKPEMKFGKPADLSGYHYTVSGQERERMQREKPGTPDEKSFTDDRAVPLTWEAYNSLSYDQKGAVDFNTLLIKARENDLVYNDPSQYTQKNIDAYNADVTSIFGEGGGSDKKAFNVVKLLKSINFKAIGQDLDEFLSLERGISVDELKDFTFSRDDVAALETFDMSAVDKAMRDTTPKYPGLPAGRGGAGITPRAYTPDPTQTAPSDEANAYADVRTDENLAAIDTSLIKGALAAYKQRLTSGTPGAWDITTALSGNTSFPQITIPVGYGRSGGNKAQYDKAIEDAFGLIAANPNKDGMAALNNFFAQYEFDAKDKKALWNYIDERTRRDLRYTGAEYVKPLRDFLGWE